MRPCLGPGENILVIVTYVISSWKRAETFQLQTICKARKKDESIISQRPSFVKVLRWLNVAEHHQFPGRIVCWIQCIFVSLELVKKSGWDIECGATLSTLQSLATSQNVRTRKCSQLRLLKAELGFNSKIDMKIESRQIFFQSHPKYWTVEVDSRTYCNVLKTNPPMSKGWFSELELSSES